MHILVIILTLIVAVLLIGIVLIQKSKGGGLSSQFGGASNMMGVAKTNSFLENGTWWLAGLIAVLSIVSAYTMPKMGDSVRTQATTTAPSPAGNQFDGNIPEFPLDQAAPAAAPEAAPEAGE